MCTYTYILYSIYKNHIRNKLNILINVPLYLDNSADDYSQSRRSWGNEVRSNVLFCIYQLNVLIT